MLLGSALLLDENDNVITTKDFQDDNLHMNSSLDISSEVDGKHSTDLFTKVFTFYSLMWYQMSILH